MVEAAPADPLDRARPAARFAVTPLDPLVVNPGRLSILLALANRETGVEFVDLRRQTRLTDGNLASHARRLADGGLIGVGKQFRDGKPVTTYLLTDSGRQALNAHVDGLLAAVQVGRPGFAANTASSAARSTASASRIGTAPAEFATVTTEEDDWVD
jgi:DNA-binding MarR family transcriptional regulator